MQVNIQPWFQNTLGADNWKNLSEFYNFYLLFILLKMFRTISFWLCWVFVALRGLSLGVASGAALKLQCLRLSVRWLLSSQSTGARSVAPGVAARGLSCPMECGIFPVQGSKPCPLHWQADSYPLCHQGSPIFIYS